MEPVFATHPNYYRFSTQPETSTTYVWYKNILNVINRYKIDEKQYVKKVGKNQHYNFSLVDILKMV